MSKFLCVIVLFAGSAVSAEKIELTPEERDILSDLQPQDRLYVTAVLGHHEIRSRVRKSGNRIVPDLRWRDIRKGFVVTDLDPVRVDQVSTSGGLLVNGRSFWIDGSTPRICSTGP